MMATATHPVASLSTTEYAVLGLLSFGERSGYEMKKAAEVGVGYVWKAAKSQIYAVLPRLVAGGFATARHVVQERRPDKQVYSITARGTDAFRAWLEEPVSDYSGRSPFLLKVFFGSLMSTEALVAHVERRRAAAVEELAEYREIEERIRDSEPSYYGYLTLRWGLAEARAWIRWADEVLRGLRGRR
jgi:PadR family transcriptional regulator, regulatory protein AphA